MDILGLIRKSLAGLGPASTRAPAAGERGLTALQDIGLNRFGQQRAEVPQDPLAALRLPELQARVAIEGQYPQLAPEAKTQLMQELVTRALRAERSDLSAQANNAWNLRREVTDTHLNDLRSRMNAFYDEIDTIPDNPFPSHASKEEYPALLQEWKRNARRETTFRRAHSKFKDFRENHYNKQDELAKIYQVLDRQIPTLAKLGKQYSQDLPTPTSEVKNILRGLGLWP